MKYIVFAEKKEGFSYENAMEKMLAIEKERRERGEAVKTLFPDHAFLTEPNKGFGVLEFEDEIDILRYERDYGPIVKLKFIPIVEGSKVIELFQK